MSALERNPQFGAPTPLKRKHQSPDHIQRSPVSASYLEKRDPFSSSSGKNSWPSRRIPKGKGSQQVRRGELQGFASIPRDPRCLSPFRRNCFPCTASTFTPRIDSHHPGTWDSPVGKPRGKASMESDRSLDPHVRKHDTAATAREEMAGACPHTR